ncbi:hypothetical protein GCM10023063_09900 [Arthrobacter methylotrophus]|uniref:Polysaccharide biosynthesis protein n=1 Tax=Arthrobacter methylotrophus TaxID=121291 RepID=A0ABV5US85_9MICC
MKPVLLRLAGFTLLPLLTLVLPFLLLPVISRVAGAPGWSSITSGQAIGVFAATIILWSWNISGPVSVARSREPHDRASIYSKSMRTRIVIGVLVLPIMSIIAAFVAHDGYRLDAVTMAWSTALTGFSPAWYGIGTGQPRILALYDTIPRFCGALLSVPLIIATGQIWIYGVLAVLATITASVAFQLRFGEPGTWFPRRPANVVREILPEAGTAAINFAGSAYASSPVPIATATVPLATATAGFASADSIYRFGLFSVVAVGNTFQSWTLEGKPEGARRRHEVALVTHLVLGAAGALGLGFLGPWASGILFGDPVKADSLTSAFYGLSFFFLSASTPLIRNLLIPAGHQKTVLLWTGLSASIGVAFMVVAGLGSNVPGVALGMALSEALLFFGLLVPASRLLPAKAQAISLDR